MTDLPLISCLMVSLMSRERLAYIRQSIADFRNQTYPNRELVMIADGRADPAVLAQVRAELVEAQISGHLELAHQGLSLGALRNLSQQRAKGEFHCVWDDDDRYHPQRLARQQEALVASGCEGLCVTQVVQFFPREGELYLINWKATEAEGFPGSLMLRADAPVTYPENGPESRLGEDTNLLAQLRARGGVAHLPDQPYLYFYQSHGANSWDDGHHAMLARTLGLSTGLLRRREAEIRANLAWLELDGVTVRGPGGPAFVIRADQTSNGSTETDSE
jgi:glycosyltransferase involved in cell wall biosynthesis